MAALQAQRADGSWATWSHDSPVRDPEKYAATILRNRGTVVRHVDECEGCYTCLVMPRRLKEGRT